MQLVCPLAKVSTGANKVLVATSSALATKGASLGTRTSQNSLYSLSTLQESEASPDIVTGMLQLFFYDVYCLFDPVLPYLM